MDRQERVSVVAIVVVALAVLGVLWLADSATAHHSTDEEPGYACVRVENTVTGGDRQLSLNTDGGTTTDTADCEELSGDQLPCALAGCRVEYGPGEQVTVTYNTVVQGIAPEAPDTVHIEVVVDDEGDGGTSRVVLLHSGAPPADDTQFSFFMTDDGLATGTPSAGTLRLYIQVDHDNAVDALDYSCSSDGDATTGASRSCDAAEAGYVRSAMDVESLSCTSPPSGSAFAYGPAGDESVTCTVDYTPPFEVETHQDISFDIIRSSDKSVLLDKPLRDAVLAGTQQESGVIDLTFDASLTSYGTRFVVSGSSELVGGAFTWTRLNDTITDGTRESDTTATKTGLFSADPRIVFSSDGSTRDDGVNTDEVVYNRGETVTYDFWLLNARDEQLTRSMTIQVRSADSTLVDSQPKTGANYAGSYVIAATDPAIANIVGDQHFFRATNTDQSADSDASHGVSSKYWVDAHIQDSNGLVKDDWPTSNATEALQFTSGEDIVYLWCHVEGIRRDNTEIDTGAGATSREIRDNAGDVQASKTGQTGADGWSVSVLQTAAVPPLGSWEGECTVSFLGNSGSEIQAFAVGSAFTGDKVVRIFARHATAGSTTYRIYALTEINENALAPDSMPDINITYIDHCKTPENFTTLIARTDMLNSVDDTATVKGPLYYFEFTPTFNEDCVFGNDGALLANVQVSVVLNGTFVQYVEAFQIVDETAASLPDIGVLEPMVAGFVGFSDEQSFTLLFYFGVFVWAFSVGWEFVGFWAIPGIFETLIPGLPMSHTTYFVFMLVGLMVHAFAGPTDIMQLQRLGNRVRRRPKR